MLTVSASYRVIFQKANESDWYLHWPLGVQLPQCTYEAIKAQYYDLFIVSSIMTSSGRPGGRRPSISLSRETRRRGRILGTR